VKISILNQKVDTIDDNYEIYLKESEDRESKEGGAIN